MTHERRTKKSSVRTVSNKTGEKEALMGAYVLNRLDECFSRLPSMDDLLSFSSNAWVDGDVVWFIFWSVGDNGVEGSRSGSRDSRSGSSCITTSGRSGLKGPLKILCCANERTGL